MINDIFFQCLTKDNFISNIKTLNFNHCHKSPKTFILLFMNSPLYFMRYISLKCLLLIIGEGSLLLTITFLMGLEFKKFINILLLYFILSLNYILCYILKDNLQNFL